MVWAIDDWHAVMYFLPRACFWPGNGTSEADGERFLGGVEARMVIAIESAWLDRIRSASVYGHLMPPDTFTLHDDEGGHWVGRETVVPEARETIDDLVGAIAAADVELRITPSLIGLWQRVVKSTLCYSGIGLRNARGWDPGLFAGGADR